MGGNTEIIKWRVLISAGIDSSNMRPKLGIERYQPKAYPIDILRIMLGSCQSIKIRIISAIFAPQIALNIPNTVGEDV